MTQATSFRSHRKQPEPQDASERWSRMAGSAVLCVAVLAFTYFGMIFWLARR